MTWWMWSLFILSMVGIIPLAVISTYFIISGFYNYPEYFILKPRKCCKFCIENVEDNNTCRVKTNIIDYMGNKTTISFNKSNENRNNTCQYYKPFMSYQILDSIFTRLSTTLSPRNMSTITNIPTFSPTVGRVRLLNQEINIVDNIHTRTIVTPTIGRTHPELTPQSVGFGITPNIIEQPEEEKQAQLEPKKSSKKKPIQKPPYTEEIINNIPNYNLRKE